MKKKSAARFEEGFCCSQAVLVTYAEHWNLDPDVFLKIADAFGAGIGGMAATCGAVTGAIMAIGLKHGRTHPDDDDAKHKTRTLVKEFVKQFKERRGTLECKHLLDIDISVPEGMQLAEEKGLFDTFCPKLIEDAVDILEKLLPEK
ncbi:MAG: C_GCAxxG_C_C family protein [bacterium]|nr:C_GCAxxG_C_C family protein [bacterium]